MRLGGLIFNPQTLIILLLMILIVVALVALVVGRRRILLDDWAHLAQGTYGIPQQAAWDDSPSDVELPPGLPEPTSAVVQQVTPQQVAPVDEYSYSRQSAKSIWFKITLFHLRIY